MYSSLVLGSVNYHGRIINQSSGNPLTLPNVRFNIKIKAGSSCIIYEENHDNINMSGSNGYFSHNIGEGSVVFGNFDNSMKIDGTSVSCSGGGSASLTSVIAKSIDVQILEFDGSDYTINISQIVGLELKDVPVAIEAKSLSGKTASSFIQVSGSVTQSALDDLISGNSGLYVLSSDLATQVSSLTTGKLNASSNLLDVPDKALARTNLGLGSLAIQNSVNDSDISSLSYSKLTGLPSTFSPSAHSHAISDVTNLQTELTTLQNNIDAKLGSSQFNLNCSASQTIQYISVSDSYQCQSIAISSSQVSGLGSLASQNSVSDADITSLSGSKLTGPIQVGTASGSTCSTVGLLRRNASTLELCNGSIWESPAATNSYYFESFKLGGNNNGTNALVFSAVIKDTASGFELANNRYRIKSAGDYLFNFQGVWTAQQSVPFTLYRNGILERTYGSNALSYYSNFTIVMSDLQVDDLITVHSATGSVLGMERAYFSGFKIGAGGGSSTVTSSDITTALGYTPVRPSNNLIDLTDVVQARTNLGLGSVATLNTITDSNITTLSGTKLTGGVQLNSVVGASCSSAGLLRYDSGNVQVCNGSAWSSISSSGSSTMAAATGNPASASAGNPIIFPIKYVDTSPSNNFYNATTGRFTIPSSGEYKLHASLNGAPPGALTFYLHVNGVLQLEIGSISSTTINANVSALRYYNAGDIVDIRPNSTYDSIGGNIFMEKAGGGGGSGTLTSADIITALSYTPQNAAKLSLNCTASQTVQYISVSDSYQCQNILVSDSNISSLAGSKLTGGVQVGTVSGTSCTSAGLTRYNSGDLEFCDGSGWKKVSSFSNSSVPVVSDWQPFTPTGSWTTNTLYFGNWRRLGDSIEVQIFVRLTGAPNATSLTVNLPSGFSIDGNKVPYGVYGYNSQRLGTGRIHDAGTAFFDASVQAISSTSVQLQLLNVANTYSLLGPVTNTTPMTWASGDDINFSYIVPISGWTSNINLNASNPVVVVAQNGSGQSIAQNVQTIITNWTEIKDPSNSFNPTTGIFTAPSAGDYEVSAIITFGDTIAAGDRIINIRDLTLSNNVVENLRPYTTAGSGQVSQPVSYILTLSQGSQVAITATQGATGNQTLVGVPRRNTLTIKKVGY